MSPVSSDFTSVQDRIGDLKTASEVKEYRLRLLRTIATNMASVYHNQLWSVHSCVANVITDVLEKAASFQ